MVLAVFILYFPCFDDDSFAHASDHLRSWKCFCTENTLQHRCCISTRIVAQKMVATQCTHKASNRKLATHSSSNSNSTSISRQRERSRG